MINRKNSNIQDEWIPLETLLERFMSLLFIKTKGETIVSRVVLFL